MQEKGKLSGILVYTNTPVLTKNPTILKYSRPFLDIILEQSRVYNYSYYFSSNLLSTTTIIISLYIPNIIYILFILIRFLYNIRMESVFLYKSISEINIKEMII